MKEIKISGFTSNTQPDDRPCVCVFGPENNVGKTRFGCTMADASDGGAVGFIALDKNTKRTVDEYVKANGVNIIVPAKSFLTDKQAISIALVDSGTPEGKKKVQEVYTEVVKNIFEMGMKLADHPDVYGIAVDGDQLYDYILFSHFGRKNQIESYMRGPANQDMIDFINALRFKNVCFMNQGAEVWKDTGEVDKQGNKKQAPSGKFKPSGFGKIGAYTTAVIELTASRKKYQGNDEDEDLADKYRARVVTCKGNTLLEGQDLKDYGVCGRDITWANVLTAIGVEG